VGSYLETGHPTPGVTDASTGSFNSQYHSVSARSIDKTFVAARVYPSWLAFFPVVNGILHHHDTALEQPTKKN
jgi:hypothetical protein